jgi:cardiolipin synthase (CMP-forming)
MPTTPIQSSEPLPQAAPRGQLWTLANGLTALRIALLAPFLYYIKVGSFGPAVIVFFIAGITDFFDGFVARRFHQQSALGRFLDPAADKLLTTASYVVMALPRAGFEPLPLWMTVAVVGRDVLILLGSLAIYLTLRYKSFKPTTLGKVNTFLEIGLVFWFIIFQLEAMKPGKILLPLMYGIVITSVVASGVEYVWMGVRILRASGKPAAREAANQ